MPSSPKTWEWPGDEARLSYAMTIHKSQGQTMTKAVIDIGDKEMAAGCTFVALSRLKSLSGLLIQPMTYNHLVYKTLED